MANVALPVLDYMKDHPDRPVTLDELEKQLKPLGRMQIASGISNLRGTGNYPQLVCLNRGVYQWNSVADDPEPATEMLVVIVKVRSDGKMLVRNTDTDELYVMEAFEF